MASPISSLGACCVLVLLGDMSVASAQSRDSKAPSRAPLSTQEIVPLHLQHQKSEVLVFERVRLQIPSTPEAPFTIRVPWDGVEHDLDLHMFDVRSSDYRLVEARDGGATIDVEPGPIHTFRGTVRDDKEATVAGATLVSGMQAVVLLADGRQIEIQPDFEAFARNDRTAFIAFDTANTVPCCDVTCGVDDTMRRGVLVPPSYGWTPGCAGDLCLAEVALDIDFPFYQTFGSSLSLASDIGALTVNIANLQYERELHIRHRLTFTVVRTSLGSEPAGYAASANTNQLLTAFQNHWNASMGGVTRDLAHLLTGRHGGAGLAYVGVTCADPFNSYGLSSLSFNLFGGVSGIGCYANVVAHEFGHNWGANHCTCSSPPYTMNPTYRPCPLRFGPTSVGEIDAWRDANNGCLGDSVYNDDAAYAMEVGPGAVVFDSNIGSSTDGSSGCGFGGNLGFNDVWYFYRPATSGLLTVTTCDAATTFDTILSVHTAAPGTTSNQIACNDDACGGSGLQSSTSANVTGGETYWIRVSGYGGATGALGLTLTGPASRAPINDARASAMDGGPGDYYGTTASATNDGTGTCGASSASPDVWYRYTPYSGETVTLSTFGSLYDTVLTVFDASGTTELFCNDDAPSPYFSLQSFVEFAPTPGATYLVRVSGFNNLTGPYVLHVSGPDAANGLCSNALTIGTGTRVGSFQGLLATDGASGCPHDEEPDLHYRFVAPTAGTLEVSTCGTHDLFGIDTGPDTVLSLHSGCPVSAGNQLACNDDNFGACTTDTSIIRDSFASANVTAGQVVYIRVSRYSAFQGRKPFLLNVGVRPANDDCSGATPIGNGTFNGTLAGGTLDGSDACVGANESDVWYLYTAACTGTLEVTTCGTHDTGGLDSGVDTVVSLHSACPGSAGNQLACNDDSYLCGTLDQGIRRDSNVNLPVVPGQQVLIRVANYPGTPRSVFTLRTSCSTGASFCWGDGAANACPCGNNAPLGTAGGCTNSFVQSGRLVASGTPRISADTVLLSGTQMGTSGSCLYFQGTATSGFGIGTVFGDGFRCAAGSVIRLGTKTNSGGSSSYPTGGDPSVHVRGGVVSPGTRYYQTWYRNAAAFCTSSTFNLTNGFQISWLP